MASDVRKLLMLETRHLAVVLQANGLSLSPSKTRGSTDHSQSVTSGSTVFNHHPRRDMGQQRRGIRPLAA
jgi:hypothetical protein